MAKKKRVKILIIPLVLIILLFLIFFIGKKSVNETDPIFYASGEKGKIGGEIEVEVYVKNNPGLAGFVLNMVYDKEKLRPLEIQQGDIVAEGLFQSNLNAQADESNLTVTWFNVSDMTEDGKLYTVRFKVLSQEKTRTPITIQYTDGNVANQRLEALEFKTKGTDITIK